MDIKEYKLKTENAKQNHPWEFARLEVVHDLLSKNLSESCAILSVKKSMCKT